MSTQLISTINNQGIVIVIDEDGEKFVPVKPICEALGISHKAQYDRIKDDAILGKYKTLCYSESKDKKRYKMVCIPFKYVFGWIFSISEKNVKKESRENLIKSKNTLYNMFFDYFIKSI